MLTVEESSTKIDKSIKSFEDVVSMSEQVSFETASLVDKGEASVPDHVSHQAAPIFESKLQLFVPMNLIDTLFNKKYISTTHVQDIMDQPNIESKNKKLLQMLKNGSIETFETTLDYFRSTQQNPVVYVLQGVYSLEGKLNTTRNTFVGTSTWKLLKHNFALLT